MYKEELNKGEGAISGVQWNARGGLRDGHRPIKTNEGSKMEQNRTEAHLNTGITILRPTKNDRHEVFSWAFCFLIGLCL